MQCKLSMNHKLYSLVETSAVFDRDIKSQLELKNRIIDGERRRRKEAFNVHLQFSAGLLNGESIKSQFSL